MQFQLLQVKEEASSRKMDPATQRLHAFTVAIHTNPTTTKPAMRPVVLQNDA